MPSERDAEMMADCPDLFGPPPWDERRTAMAWGFMIGEGWRLILLDLLDELRPIVADEGLKDFRVQQVKEKFGGLRVYLNAPSERISAAIGRAEERAARTCEACGRPGRLRTDRPHVQTLCDAHAAVRGRTPDVHPNLGRLCPDMGNTLAAAAGNCEHGDPAAVTARDLDTVDGWLLVVLSDNFLLLSGLRRAPLGGRRRPYTGRLVGVLVDVTLACDHRAGWIRLGTYRHPAGAEEDVGALPRAAEEWYRALRRGPLDPWA